MRALSIACACSETVIAASAIVREAFNNLESIGLDAFQGSP